MSSQVLNRSREMRIPAAPWQTPANEARAANRQRRIDEAARLIRQGFSTRRLAEALNLSHMTATVYRQIVIKETGTLYCACGQGMGHKGWCAFRIAGSPRRQAWLKRCAEQSRTSQAIYAARVRERREDSSWWWLIKQLTPCPERQARARRAPRQRLAPISTCYPYIREGEEVELLLLVNNAVPRTVAADVRADACQELLLAILTGELTRENFTDHIARYVRESYKQLGDKFKEVSLDAPLYRDGQTYTLLDTLAAPETPEDELFSVKHTYVRGGMPYAGALADATTAADLARRLADRWEANRLLRSEPRKTRIGIHVADRETDNRHVTASSTAGIGRIRMSSYIRHSGFGKVQPYAQNNYVRDQVAFSVKEYQEGRAEEDMGEL